MNSLRAILQDNSFTSDSLPELEQKLFFEGDRRQAYLVRFVVLLFLSTVIATYGILSDSTATVIGAMIIAPLMTPILATTAALVMGQLNRARASVAIVAGGILLVIVTSLAAGFLNIGVISVTTNSQISARITPNLNDLIVALAAGAAAAFAYSRFDVADSLPGVAIAIALVPPLSVVGLSLSTGEWEAALGASLLFTTNFLSILLAGGAVFFLLGLGQASIESRDLPRDAERRVYRYIAFGVLLVTLPLAMTTVRVATDSYLQVKAKQITRTWVESAELEHELNKVIAKQGDLLIELDGPQDPPSISELAEQLQESLPQLGTATLRINYASDLPIERTAEAEP
ncbi:MAG: DUF389 domain-containing protein [Candidatus Promineifilaceae bacterium]|jgi:uncharacterized hydrophobic protein (TIGR00271 family)